MGLTYMQETTGAAMRFLANLKNKSKTANQLAQRISAENPDENQPAMRV